MNGSKCDKEILQIELNPSGNDSTGDVNSHQANNCEIAAAKTDKLTKGPKEKLTAEDMKFMSNFDPQLSNREKKKLVRKWKKLSLKRAGKRNTTVYDENGVLKGLGKDVCDCFDEKCPGCHFPCPKCRSCKCGHECRVNRKWIYESIDDEASKSTNWNPNFLGSIIN